MQFRHESKSSWSHKRWFWGFGLLGLGLASLTPGDWEFLITIVSLGSVRIPAGILLVEMGKALLIAVGVGVLVEPYLSEQTTQGAIMALEGKILGRHEALLDEYRYVREIDWMRKNLRITFRFQERSEDADGFLRVKMTWRYCVLNYTGGRLRYRPRFRVLIGPTGDDRRIVTFDACGEDLDQGYHLVQDSHAGTDESSELRANEVKIATTGDEPLNEFVETHEWTAKQEDFESVVLDHPTLNVVVEVEGPSDLEVEVDFAHRQLEEVKPHPQDHPTRWALNKFFLPGTGFTLVWKKKEAEELVAPRLPARSESA